MIEGISGFAEALASLFALIAEIVGYLATATILIFACLISSKFRENKRREWAKNPAKKYVELGTSGVCLATLIVLVTYGVWLSCQRSHEPEIVQLKPNMGAEDARLSVRTTSAHGTTNEIELSVKRGGLKKLLETKSLPEFKQALHENVTVVQPTNSLPKSP